MTEPAAPAPSVASMPVSTPEPIERRCPWCSQLLPATASDTCPSCRANLVTRAAESMPGLTEVESDAATRARRADAPKRSKLLAWISGDVDEDSLPSSEAASEALAPPSKDVRREIWRLTLEAEGLEVLPDGEIVLQSTTPTEDTAATEQDPVSPDTTVAAAADTSAAGAADATAAAAAAEPGTTDAAAADTTAAAAGGPGTASIVAQPVDVSSGPGEVRPTA